MLLIVHLNRYNVCHTPRIILLTRFYSHPKKFWTNFRGLANLESFYLNTVFNILLHCKKKLFRQSQFCNVQRNRERRWVRHKLYWKHSFFGILRIYNKNNKLNCRLPIPNSRFPIPKLSQNPWQSFLRRMWLNVNKNTNRSKHITSSFIFTLLKGTKHTTCSKSKQFSV